MNEQARERSDSTRKPKIQRQSERIPGFIIRKVGMNTENVKKKMERESHYSEG